MRGALTRGTAILSGLGLSLGRGLVGLIYPPRCLACAEATDAPHGLCAACWRDTHFIAGAACGKCGLPLMGEAGPGDLCDGCRRHPPAWDRGAAAVVYAGAGRRAVLALKHGDRLDTVAPLAGWMAAAGRSLLADCDLIAPTPLHWRRLVMRRYNQSAELAKALGRLSGKPVALDLLRRTRATTPQEGMTRAARTANQGGAYGLSPRARVEGRSVLLVDDVLTSGATFSACTEALRAAGATRIDVLALARVAFGDSAGL
jgi:predicted amidophosphoribosyltransferase